MERRCSQRLAFSALLHRRQAQQVAYWDGLFSRAQADIDAQDRAYWGDLFESVRGAYRSPIIDDLAGIDTEPEPQLHR